MNFTGAEGSRLRRPSWIHSAENSGPKITMKIGLSDCNQLAGTVKLPSTRAV